MDSSDYLEKLLEFANMIVARLEKLSVDSIWARRASGTRRELVRLIEKIQSQSIKEPEDLDRRGADIDHLEKSVRWGLVLLKNAAREIPDTEIFRKTK